MISPGNCENQKKWKNHLENVNEVCQLHRSSIFWLHDFYSLSKLGTFPWRMPTGCCPSQETIQMVSCKLHYGTGQSGCSMWKDIFHWLNFPKAQLFVGSECVPKNRKPRLSEQKNVVTFPTKYPFTMSEFVFFPTNQHLWVSICVWNFIFSSKD